MNGISLLLLLSSLGATTGVEMGANNQPVYTIRIESLLIDELRGGRTFPILVAAKDRRIRHFKIAIIPDANVRNGGASRPSDFNSRTGDLFDYEPTQLDNGEIEYVVQISPERLQTLAAGKPIEGDIAADIAEVHRFLIFVGVGQLPSQQQAAAQQQAAVLAAGGNPPSLLRGAEVRAAPTSQSRSPAAPLTKTPFQTGTQTATQRGYQANDPLTQFNTRASEPRTNWRNQPDQSTISPPPFTNQAQQPTSSSSTYPRSPGVPAAIDRNAYTTQPTYNNPYQQPTYADPNPAYGPPNPAAYPQQGYATNPAIPYQQPPVATVAARNDLPPAANTAAVPTATGWAQPTTANQMIAQPPAVTPPTTSKGATDQERPWTPLILTTLALFASLGANAYLGWLSWSFFWRFRDAVTESARTRAQISSSRQAA